MMSIDAKRMQTKQQAAWKISSNGTPMRAFSYYRQTYCNFLFFKLW